MSRLADDLAALIALNDDPAESEERRAALNAAFCRSALSDRSGLRDALTSRDVCDRQQSWEAGVIVEALAGDPDGWLPELQWSFDLAAERLAACSDSSRAFSFFTSYAFLEHQPGKAKFAMLPRYIELTRSPRPALRRAAVGLLAGFEVATAAGARDALVRLLADADWRIRRDAEALLREESVLPSGYRPSLADALRRRLFS